MNRMKIGIELVGGKWRPYFKIGSQKFGLAYCEDEESARWMANQLVKAFEKIGFRE